MSPGAARRRRDRMPEGPVEGIANMTGEAYNPGSEGAEMAFRDVMSYGDYLHLDQILAHQHPLTDAHDEMLFVIQHQTSELWMKLAIHELQAARRELKAGATAHMFKILARVSRIFEQLNSAWNVLRTMTPADYTYFRASLGQSSGFQSWQYRMIEYMLGNRNPNMLKPFEHAPDIHKALVDELDRPSFYDDVIRLLFTTIDGPEAIVPEPQLRTPHAAVPQVQEKWKHVYRNVDAYWTLYELAEKLVDLEDYFRRWRFNHVTTVERVIGFKRGTGGTSGVQYLRKMLSVELFPELWRLRGEL
jgi:tryptophan 2,3-dioxygenase